MSFFSATAGGIVSAIDAGFDAGAALARVTIRGAFAPDVKSYSGSRFVTLSANDILTQEIALNAEDASEARKAVALDPDSVLPLAAGTVDFDVAGPLPSEEVSARPERRFVLGVVRNDTLEKLRADLAFGHRGQVEAFVFSPPTLPDAALVFEDQAGRRRRRLRRTFTALAFAFLAYAGNQALTAGSAAFDRLSQSASHQRADLERRIRVAEHRAQQSEASLVAFSTHARPSLAQVSHQLALLARNQPPDGALTSVSLDNRSLSIAGAAYSSDTTELALRRAFEGARVSFTAEPGNAPAPFQARIDQDGERSP